jgi:predicted nucleic acid-binding protein
LILLDTNIVSELMKPVPDSAVEHWYLLNEEETALPAVALAELRYGPMMAAAEAAGRPMSLPDAQIAAIALDEDAAVATRNLRHFEPAAVRLVDPWA